MADTAGPSPGRRRSDDRGPTSISPEQIAQTNATLSHFTGQRQNRWMQGYTTDAATDGVRAVGRQPINDTATAATRTKPGPPHRQRSGGGAIPDSVRPRANQLQQATPAEGAMGDARGRNPIIVDYQTPSLSSPSVSLFPSGLDSTTGNHNPGLPSPAPSDENTHSPTTAINKELAKRGRGRPRKSFPPAQTNNSGQSAFAAGFDRQLHQPQRQTSTANLDNQIMYRPTLAPAVRGQGSPATPSPQSPAAVTPHTQPDASLFNPVVLRARIDAIEGSHISTNHAAEVDKGRLALLRDATWPQTDWFYLVLSQVHALMEYQPHNLPEPIRTLPTSCWKNLDDLVCSNKAVSPQLLVWLADFPAPITRILSDAALMRPYSQCLTGVAVFLGDLPAQWDALVGQTRRMNAPPLAEDLASTLRLSSSVLQTVAFRAIVRMIYPTSTLAHVLPHLELLHRYDQQAWCRGHIRQPAEKTAAYTAFNRVRAAWEQWYKASLDHEATQRHLSPSQRTSFQQFSPGTWLPDVIFLFQGRQALPEQRPTGASLPSNAPAFVQQQQTTFIMPQQQYATMPNPQRNAHAHSSNQSVTNFNSAPQPNMPQRQTPTPNNGGASIFMPPQRFPQGSRVFFPHELDGPRSQPTEPNPTRSALHEALLRSPIAVPVQIGETTPQLYRYVSKWTLSPVRFTKDPTKIFTFDLPQKDFDRIPKSKPSCNPGEPPHRLFSEISQTYRLRCCAISPKGFRSESEWVLTDTRWPDELYLFLNDNMLETRRPLHHKKYLPIDVTQFVEPGLNTIKAVINRTSKDPRAFDFALAVEIVGVVSHSSLINNLHGKQAVSAAETKMSIQKALAGAGGDKGDDDIAITSTSMTIKLFDPFSGSKIFDTPVRGASCPHKDCFDLETFLSQCKRDRPGSPTAVDCWRCPLCRGDVRPNMLVRDDWLVEVRQTLEKQGELDTRAIIVEADGSWKPKPEEKTGVRSASLEREEGSKRGKSNEGMPVPKKVVEVIELD